MSVLRFRQLSTRRFYVVRDEVHEPPDVREGGEPAARLIELTARAPGSPPAPGTPRRARWWRPRTSSSRSPATPKTSASRLVTTRYSRRSRERSASQRAACTRASRGGHSSSTPATVPAARPLFATAYFGAWSGSGFYFDVVCPYSYMESRVVEAAEDSGRLEVEWLPFELRPAPKPLLEVHGDHLRTDWTQTVYRRALAAGVEIHLPRFQPRSTLPMAACLWASDEGRLRELKHALYEAFFCEGLDIATDAEIGARGRYRRASTPSRRSARRTTTRTSSGSAPSAGTRRPRASPACRRSSPRTAVRTGAWAASSACSRTSRSSRARRAERGTGVGSLRWSRESIASGAPPGSSARSRRSPARLTHQSEAIRRYAYTQEYRRTLDHFTGGAPRSSASPSPRTRVGTLVARNRPPGEAVFGVGSHCDSNRNGGSYDGTMGVVTALEVCRLSAENGLDLPLQLISFLEEEGSGFGQMLLGSRIMLQRVTEDDLRERFRAIDDGRSFWEHAEAAGYEPGRWRESIHVLDGLVGWIEMHIEQARVLQDTGKRIGVVNAIAGYVHADVRRARAGATTPARRRWTSGSTRRPVLAETVLELERLATAAGHGTVGTVGEIEVDPGLINAVASGGAVLARHARARGRALSRASPGTIAAFASAAAERRGMTARATRNGRRCPRRRSTGGSSPPSRPRAAETGEPWTTMHSGAAHDTMCVAERVPSAMVFVPVQGRDQPPSGRGGEPGGRGARRRDHPAGDRHAGVTRALAAHSTASTANDQTPASAANARPARAVPARIVAAPEGVHEADRGRRAPGYSAAAPVKAGANEIPATRPTTSAPATATPADRRERQRPGSSHERREHDRRANARRAAVEDPPTERP